MTNDRITITTAEEWKYCPWCGGELEIDQDLKLVVRDPKTNEIDVEASETAGFDFNNSIKHCGFDIRLWLAIDDSEANAA